MYTHIYRPIYMYIYTYIYMCTCGEFLAELNNKAKETIHMTTMYDIREKIATTQATSPENVNKAKTQCD